jgi:hypothetical protein
MGKPLIRERPGDLGARCVLHCSFYQKECTQKVRAVMMPPKRLSPRDLPPGIRTDALPLPGGGRVYFFVHERLGILGNLILSPAGGDKTQVSVELAPAIRMRRNGPSNMSYSTRSRRPASTPYRAAMERRRCRPWMMCERSADCTSGSSPASTVSRCSGS